MVELFFRPKIQVHSHSNFLPFINIVITKRELPDAAGASVGVCVYVCGCFTAPNLSPNRKCFVVKKPHLLLCTHST